MLTPGATKRRTRGASPIRWQSCIITPRIRARRRTHGNKHRATHHTGREDGTISATITWLGHASYRLTLPDERVVLIDPWLKDNPSCPDSLVDVRRCDIIALTHGHGDHTGDVARLVEQHDPLVIGNFELCNVLQSQIRAGRFSGMNTGGTQDVDGVRISLTAATHSSSVDGPDGPIYAGMPNGLVIAHDNLATIYHAGDTDVFGDMAIIAKLHAPAICILPIGDHFTMGAKGAALAAELLKPRVILPCHYKTFPMLARSADDLHAALSDALEAALVVIDVGEVVTWSLTGVARRPSTEPSAGLRR